MLLSLLLMQSNSTWSIHIYYRFILIKVILCLKLFCRLDKPTDLNICWIVSRDVTRVLIIIFLFLIDVLRSVLIITHRSDNCSTFLFVIRWTQINLMVVHLVAIIGYHIHLNVFVAIILRLTCASRLTDKATILLIYLVLVERVVNIKHRLV